MPINAHPGFDIALIGMGTQFVDHMTLEAVEALAACATGFVVSFDQEAVEEFRSNLLARIGNLHSLPPLHSLADAYRKDRIRLENYIEAARKVLDSVSNHRPVAFLTPGHPMVLDSVSQAILDGAREKNYSVRILNAVSSIDSVLAALQMELAPGIQVLEATCALWLNATLDPRVSCLLFQTSVLGSLYPTTDPDHLKQAWLHLRSYLAGFFPLDHTIFAVRTQDSSSRSATIYSCTIASLGENPENIPLGSSLYIPAIPPAQNA
jgi:hypothetical protein